jgi:hypothetical protein
MLPDLAEPGAPDFWDSYPPGTDKTDETRAAEPALVEAEAELLLIQLEAEVRRIEQRDFGDNFPPVLAIVCETWLGVARDLAANIEREAARGVDALEVLRRMPDNIQESVSNWMAQHLGTVA